MMAAGGIMLESHARERNGLATAGLPPRLHSPKPRKHTKVRVLSRPWPCVMVSQSVLRVELAAPTDGGRRLRLHRGLGDVDVRGLIHYRH
jgi:hypothetical protein